MEVVAYLGDDKLGSLLKTNTDKVSEDLSISKVLIIDNFSTD